VFASPMSTSPLSESTDFTSTSIAKNSIWAEHALIEGQWQSEVLVEIDHTGCISNVCDGQPPCANRVGILLPAIANLHSHAFQRAMAGMTETRGPDPCDSFWSWRKLMYRFLQHLTPDDVESIAAFGQIEMLESGYTSVGEFHYLHHQANGDSYSRIAEMSERLVAAAMQSGIGMTLLPVLYEQGGCDGRALAGGQKRFGNSLDRFATLYAQAQSIIADHSPHLSIGIAPHSLRAVSQVSLSGAYELADGQPFHIHIAEQEAEVREIEAAWQARPVEWLLHNQPVDQSWCLIHATQMIAEETVNLARSGAVIGLCPVTEANLGDGIFDGVRYSEHNGVWGIGTDSNVCVSLAQELKTLEYSQRLNEKARAVYASEGRSTARVLFDSARHGGACALQRETGEIAVGKAADLLALDLASTAFLAVERDQWLDSWIFASDDRLITDVWSNGNHVVVDGTHTQRELIEKRYRKTMSDLAAKL